MQIPELETVSAQFSASIEKRDGGVGECGLRGGYMELLNIHPDTIGEMYKIASINLSPNTMGQVCFAACFKPTKRSSKWYSCMAGKLAKTWHS